MPRFLSAPIVLAMLAGGCRSARPSIQFTKVPPAAEGTPFTLGAIEGRVSGAKAGQQIVLYAKADVWWIQPIVVRPFTSIQPDGSWKNSTHPGTEYAALLVDANYAPPLTTRDLPRAGGPVAAVATVKGTGTPPVEPPSKTVGFSGYQWEIRSQSTNRGFKPTPFDPANVWTDGSGFLHLRTSLEGAVWAGAEVRLDHSLGEGLYQFTVRDVSRLSASDMLSLFTWDDLAGDQQHRQVDIEIGRWGDPASKNAQYTVQPAGEPGNVVRFEAPPGPLTFSFRWGPGRVLFKTVRGQATVAAHEFTSGVPSPGGEAINISLFVDPDARLRPVAPVEVVIEKLEYLP